MQLRDDLIFLEKITIKASIGFYIIDDFTNDKPSGDIKVSVEGFNIKPKKNRSGYYIFFNLPEGEYNFVIEGAGYQKIRKEKMQIKLSDIPVLEIIRLVPFPTYTFPNGSTLFRGAVIEKGTKNPIADVKVKLRINGKDKEATTDENGEFVLYLPRLKESMIKKVDGKYLVKGDSDSIELTAAFLKTGYVDDEMFLIKDGSEEKLEKLKLEVGKETRIKKYLRKGGS